MPILAELIAPGEVRVSLQGDPEARLSATDVEQLIEVLWKTRRQMEPPIPADCPKTTSDGVMSPRIALLSLPSDPMRTVGIRHPGIGWLFFVLEGDQAAHIGSYLLSGKSDKSDPHLLN